MKRAIALTLALALLGAAGWWLHGRAARDPTAKAVIPTAQVKRGRLTVTLPVHGFLESAEVTPVRFETGRGQVGRSYRYYQTRKLVELCENNAPIKEGDLVFALETKDLIEERAKIAQQLSDAQEALHKSQADAQLQVDQAQTGVDDAQESLALTRAQCQAEREEQTAELRYQQGELARVERELERDRRLAALHYIAGTELESAEKTWRQQTFAVDKQRLALQDLEKAHAERIQAAQSSVELAQHNLDTAKQSAETSQESSRIKMDETQKNLDQLDEQIAGSRVLAPTSGFAVVSTAWISMERRPWRVGDEVYPWADPVMIYNLDKMQVRLQIGEMDISRVRQGQKAFVLSPSQSGRRYAARVGTVEEMAREADVFRGGTPGKKVFRALVNLTESDPAHLRPGMTVDVEVVLEDLKNALTVPIRAVFRHKGKAVVYRRRGDDFERVPVATGTRNDILIQVRGPLRPGDRVAALQPPAARILASAEKP